MKFYNVTISTSLAFVSTSHFWCTSYVLYILGRNWSLPSFWELFKSITFLFLSFFLLNVEWFTGHDSFTWRYNGSSYNTNQECTHIKLHTKDLFSPSQPMQPSRYCTQTIRPEHHLSEGLVSTVCIRRKKLLESAIKATSRATFCWTHSPLVEFVGEDADDMGGPQREFFRSEYLK